MRYKVKIEFDIREEDYSSYENELEMFTEAMVQFCEMENFEVTEEEIKEC